MRFIAAMGLWGALLFLLSHPPMVGLGEPAFVGWDLTRVFWADYAFAQRAIAGGELPLWNPYDRAGYPFLAEPQSGGFDPFNWLLIGIASLLGTAPAWLVIVKTVALFGFGAAGCAAYLRNRGFASWIAALASTVFVLCPRMDKLKDQSALWPAVWLGWLLLAIDRFIAAPSVRSGIALGAVAGLTIDSGYPPGAFRLALLAIPYALVELVLAVRRTVDRRAYLRSLIVPVAVSLAVLVALTAGQVWSTVQVLPDTIRAAMGEGAVLDSPIEPRHIVGLFAPFEAKSPLYLYGGFVTIIAALAALVTSARGARAQVVLFAALFVSFFAMACGDHLPVLPALLELPGFDAFRIAGHYLVVATAALILLAVHGLDALTRTRGRWRWLACGVAALEVVLFMLFSDAPSPVTVTLLVLSCVLVSALPFTVSTQQRRLGWALVIVTAIDLAIASRPMAEILQPYPTAEQIRGEVLAGSIDHRLDVRVADYEWAQRRMGPREGVRDLIGHRPALTDQRYMMLYRAGTTSSRILRATNVAVVGFDRPQPVTHSRELEPLETAVVGSGSGQPLYRVRDPWPLAFWTDDVAITDSPRAALSLLRKRTLPGAVLEREHVPAELSSLLQGTARPQQHVPARIVEQGHNTFELEIDAPAPGLLVVNEGYGAGWYAEVDGHPAPVLRTNLIFRGIAVPAGSHRVVLEYRPPGVVALWLLWLVAIISLAIYGIVVLRRS